MVEPLEGGSAALALCHQPAPLGELSPKNKTAICYPCFIPGFAGGLAVSDR
jgi:hypothetical protein